jgi:hypothetical protein
MKSRWNYGTRATGLGKGKMITKNEIDIVCERTRHFPPLYSEAFAVKDGKTYSSEYVLEQGFEFMVKYG